MFNLNNPLQELPQSAEPEMTTTAQETVSQQNQPKDTEPKIDPKVKKRNDKFKQEIDICKNYRKKLVANQTISIDYRRGKPFTSQTDEDQVAVNLDWIMTKAKQAALFSQIPQVRLDHVPDTLPRNNPWMVGYERRLNDTLVKAGIEAAMDECLPDCINAAGYGAAIVAYEAITEDREVPAIDLSQLPPMLQQQALQTGQIGGQPIPMETVPYVVDKRYTIQRKSPADLLWPTNFTGSNFDNSPWIGHSGRASWAEAVQRFKLTEEDKVAVLGEDRTAMDKLTHDVERDQAHLDDLVSYDEIFYKDYVYDTDAKSYTSIHHLVFVSGKENPVIDRPWEGQKVLEDGVIIGALSYPLKVLTLAYITDEAIPPSDSAIGRPQVNEINKARTQMIRQRERSLPVRWADVNRVDPAIMQGLMRGTWQQFIPVQGEGSRIIGEVARATMPQENFLFDNIAKTDLAREWAMHPTGPVDETAQGDPNQNVSSFNTQAGRERAKVGSFFAGIADVLGGLMCLYEDPTSFGEGFDPAFSKALRCHILTDSTVLLDSSQKLSRLNQFVNTYAKSGWINIEPVLQEIATLTGLDPTIVVRAPEPKPPVEPNISLRLTGVEDMLNPLALAFLIHSGQAPSAELIEQAKQLIQQSVVPPMPPQGPMGIPGQPSPDMPQGAPMPPPMPAPPPGTPLPSPAPPGIGEANPQWTAMGSLDKRTQGNEK